MKIKCVLMVLIMLLSSLSIRAYEFNERLEILEGKLKKSRQVLGHKSLDNIDVVKQHLTLMVEIDQEARNLFIEDVNNVKTRQLMEEIDRFNTGRLKSILEHHQWITISKFGKEADDQAWLLVQHADQEPEFQIRCVTILEKLWPLQETNKKNYAYLYDRTTLKRDLRQRYGTQAIVKNNQVELLPIEGRVDDINKRRHEMGLEPLEKYLETLKEVYIKCSKAQ